MKSLRVRAIFALIVLLAALWTLWPSFQLFQMSPEELKSLPPSQRESLQKRSLNLGLDLRGGMYLLLEVDRSKLKPEEVSGAVDRAIQIIRNRVDQWGVFEPSIQKVGENRILVQLPGVMDRERARTLIGKTAFLEFRILADPQVQQQAILRMDSVLTEKLRKDSTFLGDEVPTDHPLRSILKQYGSDLILPVDLQPLWEKILKDPEVARAVPAGYEFLMGKQFEIQGVKYRRVFLVHKKAELTGKEVSNAYHTIGSPQDPTAANQPVVILEFSPRGAARFERITEQNVGKRLAIVLDGVVQSAPVIREAIRGGSARIEGIGTLDDARDLAVILRAGALPAPLRILEERSVGPLLGKDSIQRGMKALVVGFLVVVLFMMVYYRFAGVVADIALLANMILILAVLAAFHATLTLPGIAGLILTVGMAVDANVLIFERIREEIRAGKSFYTALETGYKRAFITILDANITTLIAAVVLLRFGTGPIRGFATTLSIGIVASFFTAIYLTRIVFDWWLGRPGNKQFSI